jgi:hypothetical protein
MLTPDGCCGRLSEATHLEERERCIASRGSFYLHQLASCDNVMRNSLIYLSRLTSVSHAGYVCRKYYTLAYTNIGCLNMDHCLIINDCLGFVLFCFMFDVL